MRRTRILCAMLVSLATSMVSRGMAQEQTTGAIEVEIRRTIKLGYLLFVPEKAKKEKMPLLVFLHGAGERGSDLERLKVHGPPKIVEKKKDFPFIVLSPQCPRRGWWDADAIVKLVDKIAAEQPVDTSRIYLTGLSMGGYGTWAVAAKHPGVFAAIAPICGGGDPDTVVKMKNLPIWVFHGSQDKAVPIERSRRMVEALKAAGNDVKFTVYPDAGHDSWTETYDNPKLYEWFLAHRR